MQKEYIKYRENFYLISSNVSVLLTTLRTKSASPIVSGRFRNVLRFRGSLDDFQLSAHNPAIRKPMYFSFFDLWLIRFAAN